MSESEPESKSESEEKVEEKPAKEKKPKKQGKTFDQELKDRFGKWGYTKITDYIILIAGIYGFVWFFLRMIVDLINNPVISVGLALYWVINFIVLLMITLFPFSSKLIKKMHEKWPRVMPLSFITTETDVAEYILFISWWSALLFWWVGTQFLLHAFWRWGIVWILLTIALFKDVFDRG